MIVATPSGVSMCASYVLKSCEVCLGKEKLHADLIILDLFDFDVILGMDWLARYRAIIDCNEKRVLFSPLGGPYFTFEGSKVRPLPRLLTALQAQRCLRKGCQGFLVSVYDKELDTRGPQDVKVVQDFLDVCPEDLTELPPDREMEFTIEVVPGTAPISKAPYRMAPAILKELKEQL